MATITKTHDDYTIAWVCALSLEAAAAKAMLDKSHPPLPQPPGDDNAYELGEMSGHNIVIAYLPAGVYGTVSAATVVAQMRSSFHSVRFALLVGIGGGVPSPKHDIRLGDIVVSQPTGNLGGVVQYDYGKAIHGGFEHTGIQSPPPPVLLNAMARLKTREIDGYNPQMEMVSDLLNMNDEIKSRFRRPSDQDQLFHATYNHLKGEETCINCDKEYLTRREPRVPESIRIHYGIIASANQVMKDGITRDRIAQQYEILCFEMEAAGIMNQIPCLVVRGICDYSDSHKNKQWQGYAALVAAIYSKILLSVVPANQFRKDQTSRTASWMVPFARNPRFLGRENLVQELAHVILQKGGARKRALTGLGGTGKTQIALELAYHVHVTDPECSIFWIPAMSHESIEQAFVDINDHLGFQNVPPTEVKARVKNYLSAKRAGRWLLIIDNADDTEMWTSSSTASSTFKSYLPYSEDGFVLFTTRNRQLATRLVGPDIINVTEMDENMATDLLRESLIEKNLMQNRQTTSLLLQQLSRLPLAIVQAASYLNETGISLRAYVDLLQGQENDMIELLSEDFEDEWRYTETKNPVAVTWLISFIQIQKQNPLATDYLSFMACIHPQNIPKSLLPRAKSAVEQQRSLGLLNAYSFIIIEDDQLIHLHRLVHLATRNWLRGKDQLTQQARKMTQRLSEVFPPSANEHRALWREYMPHAQFVLQSHEFSTNSLNHIGFIQNVAECLNDDGKYYESELLFQQILKEKSTQLPKDHEDVLRSKGWVATTLRNQGRWAEAKRLQVQVMETSKTVLGPEHPHTLASMGSLASTFRDQGRWPEAEQLQVQVMETSKTVLGPKHPFTLTSMANLASTFSEQGRWPEAEQLFVQVIEISKMVLGPEHPDTLTSMANLAYTFGNQRRWPEVEQLEVQVMETRKTVLGPEHPHTLTSMNNLSHTLRSLGKHAEAVSMLETCVRLRQKRLGASHPDTVSAVETLDGWQAEGIHTDLSEKSSSDASPGPVDPTIGARTLHPSKPTIQR